MNKLQRAVSAVGVATALTFGGVAMAAPAQAHMTSTTHYEQCFVSMNGRTWCYRHCSYTAWFYGCRDGWVYWNAWYA